MLTEIKLWKDLRGSLLIGSIFSRPAEIGAVNLFSIKFDSDNSKAVIELDIPETPDQPIRKWPAESFNTCRLELSLVEITKFSVNCTPASEFFFIEIARNCEGFILVLESTQGNIEISGKDLLLSEPRVYLNNPKILY